MSEFGDVRTPEGLCSQVWESENEYEEGLRQAFLDDKLIHLGYRIDTFYDNDFSTQSLEGLKQEFLQDKKGLNMGEVFALAMSDKYRFKLHVVELGKTTHPQVTGEIDGLKGQYAQFIDWTGKQDTSNIKIEELSRGESGRYVECRTPRLEEARGQAMILIRSRLLMYGAMLHDGAPINIGIFKRMVFSVPSKTFVALVADRDQEESKRFIDERTLQIIETMLEHGSGGVKPIRTAYYLATDQ